jgi:formylglycine-generating enzyme
MKITKTCLLGLLTGWVFSACGQPSTDAASSTGTSDALSKLPRTEAPTLTTVKPPLQPRTNHHFISEKKLAELPLPQQPKELTESLMALEQGSLEERKAKLKAKVVGDLVYVRGGRFMRGDFAKLMGVEGVTRMTYNEDDKVVREITLSDFWISKYKTTYAELDVFTDAMGTPRNGMSYGLSRRHPLIPAGAYWQQASDYCQWLGKLTGLPFDLPTEAQWEYAARSRGQFFMIGTDDGNIEYGRNVPYEAQQKLLAKRYGDVWRGTYPVGLYPPNPLGIYDISHDRTEWVQDWYAADAYEHADSKNPTGPATGERKVQRGWGSDTLKIGANAWRRSELLMPMSEGVLDERGTLHPTPTPFLPGVRCAVSP